VQGDDSRADDIPLWAKRIWEGASIRETEVPESMQFQMEGETVVLPRWPWLENVVTLLMGICSPVCSTKTVLGLISWAIFH
jgi:hypothetical protein